MTAVPARTNGERDALYDAPPTLRLLLAVNPIPFPMPASRIFEPKGTVVLDLTQPPTPFDEPIGLLCDQPQPLVKLIHCWPRHLEAGDVLFANLQRPNGLPYSRRYTLVSVERVTERDCEAVIEWQDTHERQTRRFFEGLTLEQLVDGSKFTRARKDMRWVKAANGALGSWTWRGEKRK